MKKIMIIAALMLASTMMYGQLKVVKADRTEIRYTRAKTPYVDTIETRVYYVLEVGGYRFKGPEVEDMAKYGTGKFFLDKVDIDKKHLKDYGRILNNEEMCEYAQTILEYIKENETVIEEKYDVVISTFSDIDDVGGFSFYCYPKNVDELVNARKEKIQREKEMLKSHISELISENVL